MASNGGRTGALWERRRQQVFAEETHCVLCGRRVDKRLPDRDPRTGRQNPWAKTVEHTNPIAHGGRPIPPRRELRLAHRRCQQQQGGRIRAAQMKARAARAQPQVTDHGPSRNW